MSISITANVTGARLIDAAFGKRAERENDAAMAAQDAATETQSQGLKPQRTMLDQLVDRPGVLDRFVD